MATKKPAHRQLQNRHARIAAAAAARERARRRRWVAGIGVAAAVVLVALIAVLVNLGDDGDEADVVAGDDAAEGTSTTVAPDTSDPAAGSAAGKPCVEVSEALPEGAPAVPVKVGPPPSELVVEDLSPGTGAEVTATDTVTVHYIGVACSTGVIFDESYSGGNPATFPLNQVITGWQDGIPGMKVGGRRLLGIPSAQAYGPTGSLPDILPDEALWFVVEVLDAQAGAAS